MGGGGFDALYLTIACTLSSTVIIVKVLYEKRELDTLPGRITLGVLVLQDIFAILFLAVQPSLANLQISVILLSVGRVGVLVATALVLSRYVLPKLFHQIARRPELILLGALAWCFLIGEIAERLHLSREMGSLVAGVSLSTFPYALDVTAKVTTLRDFFITLFFVALGMTIPIPTLSVIWLALLIAVFTVVSRVVTTFAPLYLMKQGLRASLLPAINLAQISEFSLVVIQTGVVAGHIQTQTASAASFAFVILAVISTFVMVRSDEITRAAIAPLKRIGLRDLDHSQSHDAGHEEGHGEARRIVILGFFRAASALLSEIERQNQSLLDQITVIDFNPNVFRILADRGLHVIYGDISNVDTLVHAGVGKAELIILSIPDSLLKGANNEKLVRHVRTLNPDRQDRRHRRPVGRCRRSLRRRRRLCDRDPAQRCPRTLYGDRGRRRRLAGRQARRDGHATRRAQGSAAVGFPAIVARMERSEIRDGRQRHRLCPGLRFAPSGLRSILQAALLRHGVAGSGICLGTGQCR